MISITPEIASQRIIALHTFFESLPDHLKSRFVTAEDFYIEVFKILGHEMSAKIIYAMYLFKVSAAKELSNKINSTNSSWILSRLYYYEGIGIFEQVDTSKGDYAHYKKLWKSMYPNSPHLPVLFKINDAFVDLISLYEEDIKSRYITLQTKEILHRRVMQFQSVTDQIAREDKTKKELDSNTLYLCEECNKRIIKGEIRDKDYKIFPIGAICKKCFHESGRERLKKWIQQN